MFKKSLELKYMRRAISEARKSSPEDKRAHPKVGVVVVDKRGKIVAAHRGELLKDGNPGGHAEFVALEKLEGESLVGATVYTTLEPCTTRNHPKTPCVERLIERHVKRVVIGMLDPNPQILGLGWLALRKARIETDLFPSDLVAEIEELNHRFIRAQSSSHGRAKLVRGSEIYRQAGQLIRKAKENIAVLTYAERPPGPQWFAEQIRDHLLEQEHISFDVVIAANIKKAGIKFWIDTDARFQIYEASGLANRPARWILDTDVPTGFDVLIVDQQHVCLAFSPFPVSSEGKKQLGLFLENSGDFARVLFLWFQALKSSAESYEIRRSKIRPKRRRY